MAQGIEFNPLFRTAFYFGKDGRKYPQKVEAGLTFPDVETAVKFVTVGAHPHFVKAAGGIPQDGKTITGFHCEYDAYISRPDEETGEVGVLLRLHSRLQPYSHTLGRAALSDFIIETTEKVLTTAPS